jgi:simple sugar transport system permease protein
MELNWLDGLVVYALSGVMCALAGILMLTEFNSVRVGHGDALLLVTVLACFLGGVDPFGGFGRVAPVFVSLLILQTLSSGLNLLGANQHLSTAVWGLFLIAVMVFRSSTPTLRALFEALSHELKLAVRNLEVPARA